MAFSSTRLVGARRKRFHPIHLQVYSLFVRFNFGQRKASIFLLFELLLDDLSFSAKAAQESMTSSGPRTESPRGNANIRGRPRPLWRCALKPDCIHHLSKCLRQSRISGERWRSRRFLTSNMKIVYSLWRRESQIIHLTRRRLKATRAEYFSQRHL